MRETRSRGVFVKTLIAAVALNNIACLFLFEVARSAAILAAGDQGSLTDVHILPSVGRGAFLVGQAAFIGAVIAGITHLVSLRLPVPERWATVSAVSLLATYGLASYAGVSPLAACLTLGVVQSNLSPTRERIVDAVFATFEPVILCIFFTLAAITRSPGLSTNRRYLPHPISFFPNGRFWLTGLPFFRAHSARSRMRCDFMADSISATSDRTVSITVHIRLPAGAGMSRKWILTPFS